MASGLIALTTALKPRASLLAAGVLADLAFGDPVYRWHPVRLIGGALTWFETRLRDTGADGYGGGVVLFMLLGGTALTGLGALHELAALMSPYASWLVDVFLVYSFLALGDLLRHVWRIERAVRSNDIGAARVAVRALVGRDTEQMDGPACRRAGVESLSENLTDGFVSPVFWYAILGLPGLVLFKVVSTMDSMVGYKSPRYVRFGWCGARLDDVMNYVPARLTWLVLAAIAVAVPGCSPEKAWRIGLAQHALLLGPNSGWSEAATAGAIQRRIVGPIWLKGELVTDLWIGAPADPPLQDQDDVTRAIALITLAGIVAAAGATTLVTLFW